MVTRFAGWPHWREALGVPARVRARAFVGVHFVQAGCVCSTLRGSIHRAVYCVKVVSR